MAARKLTRKQLLREPDEFMTVTGTVIAFVRGHKIQILAVVAVLVAAGLLALGLGWYSSRTQIKALALYERASTRLANVESAGQASPEALATVEQDLQKVLDQYGGTPAGNLARMTMGDVAYKKGDFAGAVKWYGNAVEKFAEDPMSLALARSGLAYALEAQGEPDQALEAHRAVIEGPDAGLAQDSAFRSAMVLRAQGKDQEAAQALAAFVTQYPDSPYTRVAQEELNALGG
ncbi:MAG: tetratricopeptide repeat protein [Proteobacteria bacterium]|nr:tetratricopeptide repeat protein [Pseudomonadota bacterium]